MQNEATAEQAMYVVAGVSGRTGAGVADRLLGAGRRTRVIVRDPVQGRAWAARGAQVAKASIDDPRSLAAALAGATGAYLLSPQNPTSADPLADGRRIADSVARAVDEARVPHIVFLSSAAAHLAEGAGIAGTLRAAEQRLADVRCATTFLRACYFLDNWASVLGAAAAGKLPTFLSPQRALPMVSTVDVAAIAVHSLLEGPTSARDVISVEGPDDCSPARVATALTKLLGRPVEAQHVPLDALVPFFTNFGASAAYATQVRLLYQFLDSEAATDSGARLVRGSVNAEAAIASYVEARRA